MKLSRLTSALVAAGVVATAGPAFAQQRTCTAEAPCVMKIATVATAGTPWANQLDNLRSRIETESGGRIDVRAFLGSADGEVSLSRQARDGTLEAVGVSTGALATLVPQMGVFELPYLFENEQQADNVIDNHLFEPIERILGEAGFQLYIFSENGFRDYATRTGGPIDEPSDLAAIQMRSQEHWIHEETYRALGGNPVTIPTGEVSTALSNGNVQGFDNTPLYTQAAGWHSFIDSWTLSHHIYQPAVVVYNKAWFDSLPQDLQALLLSNREQETESGRTMIRAINPALINNLESFGVTVYEVTPEQRAVFRERTRGVHDMFRQRVSGGGELLDIIYAHR